MRFANPNFLKESKDGSLIAGRPANMPEFIYESIQRQYGRGSGGFTPEDAKNVIIWNQGRIRV